MRSNSDPSSYFEKLHARLNEWGLAQAQPKPLKRSVGRPRTAVGDPQMLAKRRKAGLARYWEDDAYDVWARLQHLRLRQRATQLHVPCEVTQTDLLELLAATDMVDPALDTPLLLGRGLGSGVRGDNAVVELLDYGAPITRENLIVLSCKTKHILATFSRSQIRALARFVSALDILDKLRRLS